MEFSLTDEQEALRREARTFAEREIDPRAAELDAAGEYPEEILAALGERRWTGLTIPEAYGGRGEGFVELAIVVEELSAAMMPVASALALHLGVARVIERHGSTELREQFLPEMATFETVGALGLSEEGAGSDKLAMETTAERVGDATDADSHSGENAHDRAGGGDDRSSGGADRAGGHADEDADEGEWLLNGHKRWVTNFLDADVVLTYAKTAPDEAAPHNITAFLVPTDAFDVDTVWETLGARSVKSPKVTLDDVCVSDERVVGEIDEGYVERGQVVTGVNLPARGVGIARAALADTLDYAGEREQFDQFVDEFQGVRWRFVEMAERVDAARLLTMRAAARADVGRDVGRELSMAKINASEAAVDNAEDAIDVHGGIGYTTEHAVERYLRDAKLLTIAGGPNDVHRNAVADAVIDER
jgi:alkylation response protein AidB-like acyl-CoA dehydrogenase